MTHDPLAAGRPAGANARPGPVTSLSLLQRARGRDQDAWSRLYNLYRPLVVYWCSRWGVRGEDVEDVAQEVFRAAARSLDDFRHDRPGDTFRGWLRGIARHRTLDHFRRRHADQAAGGSDALQRLGDLSDPAAAPEEDPPEELSSLY